MTYSRTYWRIAPECAVPTDGQLIQVTQGEPPLSVVDALFHLRIDAGIEDDLVESLIRSIQNELEPPNGWLGRALTTSEYKQTLPYFARRIKLAGAPIQSIDAVTYRDSSGTVQTVDPSFYRLTDGAAPMLVLEPNKEWPTDLECTPDAVSIEYTAGFGANDTSVPEIIKQYIRIMVGYRYDVRKPTVIGTTVAPNPYVRDMLESWRVRL